MQTEFWWCFSLTETEHHKIRKKLKNQNPELYYTIKRISVRNTESCTENQHWKEENVQIHVWIPTTHFFQRSCFPLLTAPFPQPSDTNLKNVTKFRIENRNNRESAKGADFDENEDNYEKLNIPFGNQRKIKLKWVKVGRWWLRV